MLKLSLIMHSVSKKVVWLLFYLCLFIFASCDNSAETVREMQTVNILDGQTTKTPVNKESSEQIIINLTKSFENKNCQEFYDSFPDNFQQFKRIYSYDMDESATLFSKYPEHFPYFFDCSDVTDQKKLQKVIQIGIDGRYDDKVPVGLIQDLTYNLIRESPNKTEELLDKLPDYKASSFWYFLFDRPEPNDKENEKKVNLLTAKLGKKSKQSKLLSKQYQKLLIDWSGN